MNIKGSTKITVVDSRTGEVRKEVTSDNSVTRAFENIVNGYVKHMSSCKVGVDRTTDLCPVMFITNYDRDRDYNVLNTYFGGVLLFSERVVSNLVMGYPEFSSFLASKGKTSNTYEVTKDGSHTYAKIKCIFNAGELEGTIKSICLTSSICGDTGLLLKTLPDITNITKRDRFLRGIQEGFYMYTSSVGYDSVGIRYSNHEDRYFDTIHIKEGNDKYYAITVGNAKYLYKEDISSFIDNDYINPATGAFNPDDSSGDITVNDTTIYDFFNSSNNAYCLKIADSEYALALQGNRMSESSTGVKAVLYDASNYTSYNKYTMTISDTQTINSDIKSLLGETSYVDYFYNIKNSSIIIDNVLYIPVIELDGQNNNDDKVFILCYDVDLSSQVTFRNMRYFSLTGTALSEFHRCFCGVSNTFKTATDTYKSYIINVQGYPYLTGNRYNGESGSVPYWCINKSTGTTTLPKITPYPNTISSGSLVDNGYYYNLGTIYDNYTSKGVEAPYCVGDGSILGKLFMNMNYLATVNNLDNEINVTSNDTVTIEYTLKW